MRLKKKKGRVVMPGNETANKLADGLMGKLQQQMQGAGAAADGDSSMMDQSVYTYYSEATMNQDAMQPGDPNISTADININAELEREEREEAKGQGKAQD